MSDQDVIAAIQLILAAGCGTAIQWLYKQYLDSRSDGGAGLSAFQKRWIALGLSAVVPTTLYAIICYAGGDTFTLLRAGAYAGIAYAATQAAHSKELLKGGE